MAIFRPFSGLKMGFGTIEVVSLIIVALNMSQNNINVCTVCMTPNYIRLLYFTTIKNFQNVLKQKEVPYGPLWSDEGLYRIAKELQLQFPE